MKEVCSFFLWFWIPLIELYYLAGCLCSVVFSIVYFLSFFYLIGVLGGILLLVSYWYPSVVSNFSRPAPILLSGEFLVEPSSPPSPLHLNTHLSRYLVCCKFITNSRWTQDNIPNFFFYLWVLRVPWCLWQNISLRISKNKFLVLRPRCLPSTSSIFLTQFRSAVAPGYTFATAPGFSLHSMLSFFSSYFLLQFSFDIYFFFTDFELPWWSVR